MSDDPTIYERVTYADVLPSVLSTVLDTLTGALDHAESGITPAVHLAGGTLTEDEAIRSGWLRNTHNLLITMLLAREMFGVQEETSEDSEVLVMGGDDPAKPVRVIIGATVLSADEADTLPVGTLLRSAVTGKVYERYAAELDGAALWRAMAVPGHCQSADIPFPASIAAAPADPEVEHERRRMARVMATNADERAKEAQA